MSIEIVTASEMLPACARGLGGLRYPRGVRWPRMHLVKAGDYSVIEVGLGHFVLQLVGTVTLW